MQSRVAAAQPLPSGCPPGSGSMHYTPLLHSCQEGCAPFKPSCRMHARTQLLPFVRAPSCCQPCAGTEPYLRSKYSAAPGACEGCWRWGQWPGWPHSAPQCLAPAERNLKYCFGMARGGWERRLDRVHVHACSAQRPLCSTIAAPACFSCVRDRCRHAMAAARCASERCTNTQTPAPQLASSTIFFKRKQKK